MKNNLGNLTDETKMFYYRLINTELKEIYSQPQKSRFVHLQ